MLEGNIKASSLPIDNLVTTDSMDWNSANYIELMAVAIRGAIILKKGGALIIQLV
jgi:hypothetical protein